MAFGFASLAVVLTAALIAAARRRRRREIPAPRAPGWHCEVSFDGDAVRSAHGLPPFAAAAPGRSAADFLASLKGAGPGVRRSVEALIEQGQPFLDFGELPGCGLVRFTGTVQGMQARLRLEGATEGERVLIRRLDTAREGVRAEERIAARSDKSPLAAIETDPAGIVTWRNAAAEALLCSGDRPGSLRAVLPAGADGPTLLKAADGSVFGWANVSSARGAGGHSLTFIEDIDPRIRAEEALDSFVATLTETFAHLPIALAIFDRERRLSLFNPALAELFEIDTAELAARPSLRDFLEALRRARMVPEQQDFTAWRKSLSDWTAGPEQKIYAEDWTLPSGRILRVTGRPHPKGAIAFIFEDISGHVMLERRFRAEIELGQATLDRIGEGIAVFGKSGQLLLANPAFGAALALGSAPDSGTVDDLIGRAAEPGWLGPALQEFKEFALESDRPGNRAWSAPAGPGRKPLALRASALPDGSTLLVVSGGRPPAAPEAELAVEAPLLPEAS